MKWHYTGDGDKPKCLEVLREKIPCLVQTYPCNGKAAAFDVYFWDSWNECWYTQKGFERDFDRVQRWAYVEDEKYETT